MKSDSKLSTATLRRKVKAIQKDLASTREMIAQWTDEEKARFTSSISARERKIERLNEILRSRGEEV